MTGNVRPIAALPTLLAASALLVGAPRSEPVRAQTTTVPNFEIDPLLMPRLGFVRPRLGMAAGAPFLPVLSPRRVLTPGPGASARGKRCRTR
jgi:hypothetical protein